MRLIDGRLLIAVSIVAIIAIIFSNTMVSGGARAPERTLIIWGMDSENYYIDFAEVTISNSNGVEVFNGYLINTSVPMYNLYYDAYYNAPQTGYNLSFNISLEEGVYNIRAIRDSNEISENYREGYLLYEDTVSISEDTNISLFLEFQPNENISDTSIDMVLWIRNNTSSFILIIAILFFILFWVNYLLRTRFDQEYPALIIYFIPIATIIFVWLWLGAIEDSNALTIGLYNTRSLILGGIVLGCFVYAITSYLLSRSYKKELTPHPVGGIYKLSAIIFSFGALAILFIFTMTGMVTCYMPMMPQGPPRKLGLVALGLITQRQHLLQKFRDNGVIEERTYDKLIWKK